MLTQIRRPAAFAVTIALLATTACYDYVPVATPPAPSQTLRLYLTRQGSQSIASQVGPKAAWVEGKVLEANDTAYVIGVTALSRESGVDEPWQGERIVVPHADVDRAGLQQLSKGRSWLAAAAVTGLLAVARVLVSGSDQTGNGGSDGAGNAR